MSGDTLEAMRKARLPEPLINAFEALETSLHLMKQRNDAQAGHITTLERLVKTQAELIERLKADRLPACRQAFALGRAQIRSRR